jgi:hypothetical protein
MGILDPISDSEQNVFGVDEEELVNLMRTSMANSLFAVPMRQERDFLTTSKSPIPSKASTSLLM